jgi:hypothetical protein
MSEARQESWRYSFPDRNGMPVRGTILATNREDAEKRLRSMGIPGAALEDQGGTAKAPEQSAKEVLLGSDTTAVPQAQREVLPRLVANPVRVLDQISKSAQNMVEGRDPRTGLDNGGDSGKKVPVGHVRTRERILFGEPEKTISVADKLLSERNGTVTHFSTAIDPKGKFLVAIVVRHEVEDENET